MIQLVYLSTAVLSLPVDALTSILMTSRRKNEMLGITGLLVYHDGLFLQILEGMEQTVETVYGQIVEDERHKSCTILHRGEIAEREFADWTMGFVNTRVRMPASFPGFNDIFNKRFDPLAFGKNPSLALQFLASFRQEQWRIAVEVNNAV